MTLEKNFEQAEKAAEEQQQQAEQETIQAYREYLKEVRAEVGFNYEKFAVAGALIWAIMMKGNRLTKLEKAIASEASKLYTKTKNVTEEAIKDVFSECYYRAGWTMETGAGVSLGFDILNPDVVEAAILNPYDRITWPERMKANTEVMVRQIREEITRGIIQGYSYDKTARAITERINVGASKAIRIVQTETGRAQSQGTQAAFEKASKEGLVFKKVWVSTLDGRTRDKHRMLDGQKVNPDEPFKYGGMEAMYPRGWGVPEMDINCRCTVRAEIEGMEPTSRRARNPVTGKNEVIPNMTYEEWYESRVKTEPKALLAEKMHKNRFVDKKQHEAYKKVLGKDAPSSFEKFQNLKYNNPSEYEFLKKFYIDKNTNRLPSSMSYSIYKNNLSGKNWTAVDFAPGKLQKHSKHLNEYDNISLEEYRDMAVKLLESPIGGNIEGFTTKDGYVLRYDIKSNDFASAKPNGVIETMFKPKRGKIYWKKQIDKYGGDE